VRTHILAVGLGEIMHGFENLRTIPCQRRWGQTLEQERSVAQYPVFMSLTLVEGLGLERIGVQFDRQKNIATDDRRRTTVGHIYASGAL
jgi:hypothetical protein